MTLHDIREPNRCPVLTSDWNTEWREIWATSFRSVCWGLGATRDHRVSPIQVTWGNLISAVDRYGLRGVKSLPSSVGQAMPSGESAMRKNRARQAERLTGERILKKPSQFSMQAVALQPSSVSLRSLRRRFGLLWRLTKES
jgi:hypothetical protein